MVITTIILPDIDLPDTETTQNRLQKSHGEIESVAFCL